MGGLINSSTVKGDLWMIEAGGSMSCYPLATTAEGPGPRVGHASLLVGNAFIVYGGDTKIEDTDVLDETLYLLNTSTRHWSRALPAGPRPSGRYGHSLNILGSKIYIFGGQVEGYFMNDLAAFDLNQLQMANNRWEILLQSDASPSIPAARTNHTVITYNDKMYLFGGTNGFEWFNDVWCYDPATNKWSQLDCIGYIPSRREGHAAALVDDVMYIFGGRTEEGTDLGDLAAFRISLRRWYTFQNMGPSPSPRSGHSMTTVGKSIVVLGGEPSTAASTVNDLGILYVLDTTKIRYPADAQQSSVRAPQPGRPSLETANRGSPGAASPGPDRRLVQGAAAGTLAGAAGAAATAALANGPGQGPSQAPGRGSPAQGSGPIGSPDSSRSLNPSSPEPPGGVGAGSKLPRPAPPPVSSPPQPPGGPKAGADQSAIGRVRGASVDRPGPGSPKPGSVEATARQLSSEPETATAAATAATATGAAAVGAAAINGHRSPPQGSRAVSATEKTRSPRPSQGSIDSTLESSRVNRPASPPPPTRQVSNAMSRRSSGRNSQTVALLKELDAARNKNAWYASELELARKGGYVPNTSSSPALDKSSETFDDEDRPLIEALLAMRTELANVQSAVDKQAVVAAKQIAEAERQRDAAIQEAVYAKAKVAAFTGSSAASTPQLDGERDEAGRSDGISRKLAAALHVQKEMQTHVDSMKSELEAEKRARQLADDTSNAAEKRLAHLETYKQQTSAEVERLKSELHLSQREAREHSVSCADAVSALALLKAEKEAIDSKYNDAVGTSKNHDETFGSLRAAIKASEDGKSHVEKKLAEERSAREKLETKFNKLKVEHEARTAELVASGQRLRDAEELAEKHANEAKTHRQAVLSGLDKITLRDASKSNSGETERSAALQTQVTSANALVKKYQQELDTAADKLRSAEERIAGLEQYQEQSSRDGVSIRRQLQAALRETQSLQASHSDVKNQLAAQQLETNAMTVQHTALKDILNERGISPTAATAVRSRSRNSPRTTSPEQTRLRDLESQLASSHASHEETKQAFAAQAQESESAYREKLAQLENDYQSAVHYVKGTEKMLKQLKEQLSRYKSENTRLKSDMDSMEERLQNGEGNSRSVEAPAHWESERTELQQQVESLQDELRTSGSQLEKKYETVQRELADLQKEKSTTSKQLSTHMKDLEQLRSENALLEQRATDAEQKVSLLLDQVEHSVDSYRRRSRQTNLPAVEPSSNGAGLGHARDESSEVESVYGHSSTDGRNSAALDNLASELETLRTHWEATNKNYRLSGNFDFDPPADLKKENDGMAGAGLSESLADWRKKLDAEEHTDGPKTN